MADETAWLIERADPNYPGQVDLYTAVAAEVAKGTPVAGIRVSLPETDSNWVPKDLTLDIESTASEVIGKAPAGGLPHVWK